MKMDLTLARKIKRVLFDVDGVMTDGSIFMSGEGEIIKKFNVKDGLAIELLRSHGFITGVISGKASDALNARCEQLGFDIVITGCKNKLPEIHKLCNIYNVLEGEIAFCGDDILDIPVFKNIGLAISPSDGHALAIESAHWIMKSVSRNGMIREFVDLLITNKFGISLTEAYKSLLEKIQTDCVEELEQ